MATPTANYGFIKDAPTQLYDVAVVNANLDAIDGVLKTQANTDSDYGGRITALEGKVKSPPPMCRVTATANQTISHNVTEIFDMVTAVTNFESVAGMADKGHDKLICKVAGWYTVTFRVVFDNSAVGHRVGTIMKNGSIIADDYRPALPTSTVNTPFTLTSAPIQLALNDYIEASVYQNCNNPLNLTITNGSYSSLQLSWFSPL